jgi:hypothetical protein
MAIDSRATTTKESPLEKEDMNGLMEVLMKENS